MIGTVRKLWKHEDGAIISAELVLVMTIVVLSMLVGLNKIAISVNSELNDVANAFGAINQSYGWCGIASCCAGVPGSAFADGPDKCDCQGLNHRNPRVHQGGSPGTASSFDFPSGTEDNE